MEDDTESVSVVSPDDDLAPRGTTAMVEKWSDHTTHDGVIVDDRGMMLTRCPGTMVAATIDTVEVQMKTPSTTQAFFVPPAQLCALTSSKASQPLSSPNLFYPVKWHDERFGTPEACTTNSRHADGGGTSAGSATSWWGVGGDGAPLWWGGGGGGGAGDEPPPLTYEEMTRSPPRSLGLKYVAPIFTRGDHCSRGDAAGVGGYHLGWVMQNGGFVRARARVCRSHGLSVAHARGAAAVGTRGRSNTSSMSRARRSRTTTDQTRPRCTTSKSNLKMTTPRTTRRTTTVGTRRTTAMPPQRTRRRSRTRTTTATTTTVTATMAAATSTTKATTPKTTLKREPESFFPFFFQSHPRLLLLQFISKLKKRLMMAMNHTKS